jgi:hypothetical protein
MATTSTERTRRWRANKRGEETPPRGRGRPRVYTAEEVKERRRKYQQKYYLEVTKPKRKGLTR